MLTRTAGVVLALAITSVATADSIEVTGTVRDFPAAHPDFDVVPAGGPGHYAGNVLPLLTGDRRPILSEGTGFKVLGQWRDAGGYPIAPHLFRNTGKDACGSDLADTTGTAGVRGNGGILSTASFTEWFRDIPGVNVSGTHPIRLERDGAGVFSYSTEEFHPIDGRLLGNEGADHNHHFTYQITASFTYKECWAQFIELLGGDGVWVYIDGRLVIDIGGVDAYDEQQVWLDRLGLTDGETYTLDLFYAQRQTTNSVLRLRTTLELESTGPQPTVSAAFD